MNHAVAAEFDLADHASPASKRQQRRREEFRPLRLGNSENFERFADRFERSDVLVFEAAQLTCQPTHPGARRAEPLAIESTERAIESLVTVRKLPVSQPLIEERRTKPDQKVVDARIGVSSSR